MGSAVEMSDARLQIHFDVHNPIELVELTLSLQALAYRIVYFILDWYEVPVFKDLINKGF